MIEYPNRIRKFLLLLGFNTKYPNTIQKKGMVYIILSLYIQTECIKSLIDNWEDTKLRFEISEHFFYIITCTLITMEFAFNRKNIENLLNISENYFFSYDLKFSKYEIMADKIIKNINKKVFIIYIILSVQVISMIFSPIIILIYSLINEKNILIKDYPLPLSQSYECKNIFIYLIIYILQSIYLSGDLMLAYCFNNSCIFAMQRITYEEKLFICMLNYIDYLFYEKIIKIRIKKLILI